jgi:hypothetical protein
MSDNASQTRESIDRQPDAGHGCPPGVSVVRQRVDCGPRRGETVGCASTAATALRVPPASRAGGELAAYYRLRCIALEAAVDRLGDELERERQRLDEVVARYESILQERGAEGAVTDGRR